MTMENVNEKVFDRSELGENKIYADKYDGDHVYIKSYVYEDEVGSVGDLIPQIHKEVTFRYKGKTVKTFIYRSVYDTEMDEAVRYWKRLIVRETGAWQKMMKFFGVE